MSPAKSGCCFFRPEVLGCPQANGRITASGGAAFVTQRLLRFPRDTLRLKDGSRQAETLIESRYRDSLARNHTLWGPSQGEFSTKKRGVRSSPRPLATSRRDWRTSRRGRRLAWLASGPPTSDHRLHAGPQRLQMSRNRCPFESMPYTLCICPRLSMSGNDS